jgi:hypothetical protein
MVLPATSPEHITTEQTGRKCGRMTLYSNVMPPIPILSGNDWPYPVNSVLNTGVGRLPDGDTLLLVVWKMGRACPTSALLVAPAYPEAYARYRSKSYAK